MTTLVHALDKPGLAPFRMPDRFRHDVTYFCTPAGEPGAPERLGEREYWVRLEDARQVFEDGVIRIVSPLDSDATAEIELTEEQEAWLEWMIGNEVQHVRVEEERG
jgi:hypothetical protein